MRELEVQLSKKDILRMMSDMRLKKDGMKESKIQAVMLIIAGISLIYIVGVVLIGGHDPSILWWITDLCAGIGAVAWLCRDDYGSYQNGSILQNHKRSAYAPAAGTVWRTSD
jgi:hypothetical protein